MMISKVTLGALFFVATTAAHAHFQVLIPEKAAITEADGSEVVLDAVFSHPFEGGPLMDMGKDETGELHPPLKAGVMHRGETTDLTDALEPVTYEGLDGKAQGYRLKHELKGMGDFVYFLDPAPYWEPGEGLYIRHVTKVVVNREGWGSDWRKPVGLEAEILPLVKPYALWAGNVFKGKVMRMEGDELKPVPNAYIEVEFLNHGIVGAMIARDAEVEAPQSAFVTQGIHADANGEFIYGIPRAGWWSFAAFTAKDTDRHNGKEMELNAVLWVHAEDME
jgi:cobalt/nickel transport protein